MITKDEITVDATEYPYERKYSTSNEHFLDTFPWQDFFPDIPLTFPWHVSNSLTFPGFPGFPDKWSPCEQKQFYKSNVWQKCGTWQKLTSACCGQQIHDEASCQQHSPKEKQADEATSEWEMRQSLLQMSIAKVPLPLCMTDLALLYDAIKIIMCSNHKVLHDNNTDF